MRGQKLLERVDKEAKNLMSEQMKSAGAAGRDGGGAAEDQTRDNEENELEAEQESAAAMDADVPHPPDDQKSSGQ